MIIVCTNYCNSRKKSGKCCFRWLHLNKASEIFVDDYFLLLKKHQKKSTNADELNIEKVNLTISPFAQVYPPGLQLAQRVTSNPSGQASPVDPRKPSLQSSVEPRSNLVLLLAKMDLNGVKVLISLREQYQKSPTSCHQEGYTLHPPLKPLGMRLHPGGVISNCSSQPTSRYSTCI